MIEPLEGSLSTGNHGLCIQKKSIIGQSTERVRYMIPYNALLCGVLCVVEFFTVLRESCSRNIVGMPLNYILFSFNILDSCEGRLTEALADYPKCFVFLIS